MTFIFSCPINKLPVQCRAANDAPEQTDIYAPLRCLACDMVHYVNPTTGKVWGGEDENELCRFISANVQPN